MSATVLTSRAIIRLSPLDESEDVAAFLQGLVTNDVTGPLPCYAALLSAQGKHLFDFLVWGDGADLLLDCEAAIADELVKRLSMYRLRRKIGIARDDSLAVHWNWKEPASLAFIPGKPPGLNGSSELVARDPRLPELGIRWVVPIDNEPEKDADSLWLAHRLQLGVPEGRAELGDILWLETNAVELNGVSFTKGCYVGQENTARMNWRQKVNRRLVVVPLAGSDEARRVATYPDLGFAVDHLRVENLDPATLPEWQRAGVLTPEA
ncbi:YgfZ/GcvT domain-containing protein [Porphyrobacter sp. ULC335]|uniref:CAF17-like 4Fe-4S cluster assembly/insertion protein YgfZ n=1 Tax=Porphyrobacter sp. ULC335 TaxID=2854260 RepID=UPI00221EEDAE|nr:folate-binding protein [Porphyrobacter sp. ULC335]UYV14337.1 folate-binding protein [Porphyrobacter sp. ULC335]